MQKERLVNLTNNRNYPKWNAERKNECDKWTESINESWAKQNQYTLHVIQFHEKKERKGSKQLEKNE